MRIGFVSIYSWRPHVEHLHYLATLARLAGHDAEFLTCDGDFPTCYTRELRSVRPGWRECLMCRVGGLRSYESSNVSTIGEFARSTAFSQMPEESTTWGLSSASSLGRFESEADFSSQAFHALADRLQPVVAKAYGAACNWIANRRLDAIVVFNGRMDATRAILEAATSNGIPFASLERTWFGDGLQILPGEGCLGLKSVDRLVSQFADKPLTHAQSIRAAGYIASRFLRRNHNEWRAYNINANMLPWPASGRRKILLIPGSINEIWGYSEWSSSWRHPLDAYDALIDHFSLDPADLVLRCHPNWGEHIGKADGQMAEEYYTQWAEQRGVLVIPSTDSASTLGLIEQADAVVVASGSAALEAGALGKQVIGVAGANYQMAGIREDACSEQKLRTLQLRASLPQAEQDSLASSVRRQTLRFAYSVTHRIPQYVDYVKCVTPTQYLYKPGADPNRLVELLTSGVLAPDDGEWSRDDQGELDVLESMRDKRWETLFQRREVSLDYASIRRRFPYGSLDAIRGLMRVGDR